RAGFGLAGRHGLRRSDSLLAAGHFRRGRRRPLHLAEPAAGVLPDSRRLDFAAVLRAGLRPERVRGRALPVGGLRCGRGHHGTADRALRHGPQRRHRLGAGRAGPDGGKLRPRGHDLHRTHPGRARGNEGVAGLVRQTPGAIGYVEQAYAEQNNLAQAALQNKDGYFVLPSLEGASLTAAGVEMPPDYRVSIVNGSGKDAYPIATFTWLLEI